MGLDTVELMMRLEEEFSIDLPDAELGSVRTVGDLYGIILSRIETRGSNRPNIAFYRLRRAMIACLGLERKAVRPATKLAQLMPKSTRIAAWKSIAEVGGLEFPKLRHPRWARDTIRVLGCVTGIAFLVGMMNWTSPSGAVWVPLFLATVIIGLFAWKALYGVTPFLAYELPMRTVGELIDQLVVLNMDELGSEAGVVAPLSRQEVWLKMVQIICDQLGLEWERVVPEARFVDDLRVE